LLTQSFDAGGVETAPCVIDRGDPKPVGFENSFEVQIDPLSDRLLIDAHVAEADEVIFQALEFYAFPTGRVVLDANRGDIRQPAERAHGAEFCGFGADVLSRAVKCKRLQKLGPDVAFILKLKGLSFGDGHL